MWDPDAYLNFADERGRPFFELLSRVPARQPQRVVDLGCGPGNLTATLDRRWPGATIEALDSSVEMVEQARNRGVDARVGDLREWIPAQDTDVVCSNAALQWIPEHADLLRRWASQLPAGAWLCFQVPGNFDAPSHRSVCELADREQWAELLCDMPFRDAEVVRSPLAYAELLTDAGCAVDAWETTYVHELHGEHPVLEWITGTALRPVASTLTADQWQRFRSELIPMLAEAYPARADGRTFFPFRRVFVVAQVGRGIQGRIQR